MLTLTLFRHAKSSWDYPNLEDIDRPLTPRGEAAAPLMAANLAKHSIAPDLILCSPSQRTRQTIVLALPAFATRPEVDYADALYHAGVETLHAILRHVPAAARSVMIVGHNPGLQSFAMHLIGSGEPKALHAIAGKFPTSGAAVITFDAKDWSKIKRASGHLDMFVTPRMLEG